MAQTLPSSNHSRLQLRQRGALARPYVRGASTVLDRWVVDGQHSQEHRCLRWHRSGRRSESTDEPVAAVLLLTFGRAAGGHGPRRLSHEPAG